MGTRFHCITILRDLNFPKISRDNGKGGNEIMDYAYFIENTNENYIDNTELFNKIRDLYIDENEVYSDVEDSKEELGQLLDAIDYDDKLIVRSVVDLADTAKGLLKILSQLQDRGVILESVSEPYISKENYYLTFKDFIHITNHYAEKSRQDGYRRAKEKGIVGRPAKTEEIEKAIKLYKTKAFTISEIEDLTKISKTTLYRYLKDIDRDE